MATQDSELVIELLTREVYAQREAVEVFREKWKVVWKQHADERQDRQIIQAQVRKAVGALSDLPRDVYKRVAETILHALEVKRDA